ncbi:MAG: DUF192 domain-containing protein [Candidatus Nanohalobium sp.]
MRANPFRILPFILAVQILAGIILGAPTTVSFPESSATLHVEVADSEQERLKGLMYRKKLPINQGMLFVFPKEAPRGFWMKNTLIPLDMIFVDRNGRIINIEEAYPEPNTSEENLKIYRSEAPARYVIETNSTFTEKKNIEEGDRVEIPTRY